VSSRCWPSAVHSWRNRTSSSGRAAAWVESAHAGDPDPRHKGHRAERQISILVTEQYARPVLPIVDYAFILENGAAVMEGTRQELLNNPDVRAAISAYKSVIG